MRRIAALLIAGWLIVGALPALAHNGEDDIAQVLLSGSSQADGRAMLRVDVAEQAACERLQPLRLEAIRAEREATGSLKRVEPCRFEGEIVLPEPGRWMVAASFAYDGGEAQVSMPVGVTDTTQQFERDDFLHAVAVEESSRDSSQMVLFAALGLGIGAALALGYRWWRASTRNRVAVRER